jgi:hypothetical protein
METFSKESLGERPDDWDGLYGYKPIGGLRARELYDNDMWNEKNPGKGRKKEFTRAELLSDKWHHLVDNELPIALSQTTTLWKEAQQMPAATKICRDCSIYQFLLEQKSRLIIEIGKLSETQAACDLCSIFFRHLHRRAVGQNETITIYRDYSELKMVSLF